MKIRLLCAVAALTLLSSVGAASAAGTLFIGTDQKSFNGTLPDELSVAAVNGANVTSQTNYSTSFHLNGLTDVSGHNYLYTGDPFSNVINTVSYTGTLLASKAVTGMSTGCCNEDMIWTGTQLYHGQYGNGIQLINLAAGTIVSTQSQPDVVGMSYADGNIWITHWGGRQVGIWDPTTNIFTAKFNTPNNAGGLAFDNANQIMWVGMEGGSVVPYTLAGVALNGGFQPVPGDFDTIDGLAFLGEARAPEPATWALMLIGVGSVGAVMRSRRRTIAAAD